MDPIRECAKYNRQGPTDLSILYLQTRHRPEALWQGHDTPTVLPRRTRSTTFGYLPPAFVPLLIASGFYRASRANFFPYDWHLVTALIMRWRLETHTFHMAVGVVETTITLEDVAIQLGLQIEGKAVVESTSHNWAELCQELLGKTPMKPDIERQRAYIVRLIDGFLMPDTSGNKRRGGTARTWAGVPNFCLRGRGTYFPPRAKVERAQGPQVECRAHLIKLPNFFSKPSIASFCTASAARELSSNLAASANLPSDKLTLSRASPNSPSRRLILSFASS
ncbi:serine/threonine-protein phosphatase 7 long form-like protein [Senna tora]|uniref:Serine/threonine-protein phosphatase 7 long form-like protein n=1 Tax=Senna tora TaxID=362788 RepID=A0A834VZ24_9FABA|nr:serine/threonine-protein phosphatase 7 long form-like protein [Senna tora]